MALLWSSERATPDRVRAEVLAAIYRTRYLQQHALPKTLGQMMQQEGLAAVFADLAQPVFSSADLAALRTAIDPYRGSAHFPTAFACLYGDDAARVVGYPPLGLPTLAGFALAADEIRRRKLSPEAALLNAAPPVR
ncbi:MAG: hypothetical protein ACR2PL_07990 [Dehalococcoidia bacterium]